MQPAAGIALLAGRLGEQGNIDGTGPAARFRFPSGATAVDASGNVYLADTYNYTVRKITPAGVVTTLAGVAGSWGVVTGPLPGSLSSPGGVAVDASGTMLHVSSIGENAVLQIQLP